MKSLWSAEALTEHWWLSVDEHKLLSNRIARNRLGLAVQLKVYQYEGRFPRSSVHVPTTVLSYLAQQLDLPPEEFAGYRFDSRTAKRHRAEILRFLELSAATANDRRRLKNWLKEHVIPCDSHVKRAIDTAIQWFQRERLAPPTDGELGKLVRSVIREYYDDLFSTISAKLAPSAKSLMDTLLRDGWPCPVKLPGRRGDGRVRFRDLATHPGPITVKTVGREVAKLHCIRELGLTSDLFRHLPMRLLARNAERIASARPWEIRRHPAAIRYSTLAAFCWHRHQAITDALVDLLMLMVHRLKRRAKEKVDKKLLKDIRRVHGKTRILYKIASLALAHPEWTVKDAIYPVVGEDTLKDLVDEFESGELDYDQEVFRNMRSSYAHHYRKVLPLLFGALDFRCHRLRHQPVVRAAAWLRDNWSDSRRFLECDEVPIEGVVKRKWRPYVVEWDRQGIARINRISYEIAVLQALQEGLRCKEIWVVGAFRHRDPGEDLPVDFASNRASYYESLELPRDAGAFIQRLKMAMTDALTTLDKGLPHNAQVEITDRPKRAIKVSPVKRQPDPPNLLQLKADVFKGWDGTSLLDVLKETDLRVGFTDVLRSVAQRESLDPKVLRERLLLCLYGMGTNTGLKRVATSEQSHTYDELLHVRRRYIQESTLREAITEVINATFEARYPEIWGEGTTACASDSKHFPAWDQNLMTEWHIRHGGRRIGVYWHVEKKAACIYSQVKRSSSSEVAAMIEGVLRHCTDMDVQKNYVDSHGQSQVGFAMCYLLGFDLLPRLKDIASQKLYLPGKEQAHAYANLQPILTGPIRWHLIEEQYDEFVRLATALRLGTGDSESILRRFTNRNYTHPTYRALAELGKVIKTIFLCRYLHSEALRREIHQALNVVENWNSANAFIYYGKHGELATNKPEAQRLSILALHLLQSSLVYINTLMIQDVLSRQSWQNRMAPEDYRALTPLLYAHVNPYGRFELDMETRLPIEEARGLAA